MSIYKIIDCVQGSDEWHSARIGLMTASTFSKLITNTGKPSASWEDLVNTCVAEIILGGKDEGFETPAMVRGASLENEALNFFNISYDFNFQKIGFMQSVKDETPLLYGCSPDGIDFGRRIGIELKCPLSHNHIKYLVGGQLPPQYKAQVQGQLLVTGFDHWIFGSYHPSLKCLCVSVERDEKFISVLKERLDFCADEILKRVNKYKEA